MNVSIQCVLGYIVAALTVGTFHWFEDSYVVCCRDLPRRSVIIKNTLHQYFPREITYFSGLENVHVTLSFTILIFIILYLIIPLEFVLKYRVTFITFFCFSVYANVIHKFFNLQPRIKFRDNRAKNKCIKVYQEKTSRHYLINCYSNMVLDYLSFWDIVENNILFITSVEPKYIRYDHCSSIHISFTNRLRSNCL